MYHVITSFILISLSYHIWQMNSIDLRTIFKRSRRLRFKSKRRSLLRRIFMKKLVAVCVLGSEAAHAAGSHTAGTSHAAATAAAHHLVGNGVGLNAVDDQGAAGLLRLSVVVAG